MFNRFMITAATAALIAGTGFANAQGTMGRDAPSAGSTVQQSAPSSEKGAPSATPMNRDKASDSKGLDKGMKSTQSDQKAVPNSANKPSAQGDIKAGPKDEKSAQENNLKGEKSAQDNNLKGERSKSMSSETSGPAGNDVKAEGRNGNTSAETKGTADGKATTTTGQAGAGAKLSTEQRTRITSVIRDQHVAPVTDVNFAISIGTRIPRDVTFHPLPTEIVSIYPEWRGYEFILVRDQILVVDPRTLEIVAVLEA
jgi:hypothetical protein